MRRLTIAIDCDDVLAESATGFIAFSNDRWGTNLTIDDYDEHWAEMWGVDSKEAERRATELHDSSSMREYGHVGGAFDVLSRLAKKHHLVITTSRRLQMRGDTLAWIEEHFPGVFSSNAVYFAGIWDNIKPDSHRMTKAELINQVNADVLIDDQFKHCAAVAGSGRQAILFGEYKWNRVDSLPERVPRCTSWSEVEQEIERIANS